MVLPPAPCPPDEWPRPPAWQRGGHRQTVAAAFWARRTPSALPAWRRQRWSTPDGDFVDADTLLPPVPQGLVVLFHGLEGSSRSHYAQALAWVALQRGWGVVVPHFRGCSGEPNRAPRAYHSGDHAEIDWMLARGREPHQLRTGRACPRRARWRSLVARLRPGLVAGSGSDAGTSTGVRATSVTRSQRWSMSPSSRVAPWWTASTLLPSGSSRKPP